MCAGSAGPGHLHLLNGLCDAEVSIRGHAHRWLEHEAVRRGGGAGRAAEGLRSPRTPAPLRSGPLSPLMRRQPACSFLNLPFCHPSSMVLPTPSIWTPAWRWRPKLRSRTVAGRCRALLCPRRQYGKRAAGRRDQGVGRTRRDGVRRQGSGAGGRPAFRLTKPTSAI